MQADFSPRLTKPERGNPYYNRPQSGGYAVGIIQGSPLDAGCDVLANCVGYAAGRFNEIIGQNCFVHFRYAPDPDQWIARAQAEGLQSGTEPQLGAVAVWTHHVAVVEQINADGSITTSESGYGCANPFWISQRSRGGGSWGGEGFLGFIYQPKEAKPMKGIDISYCQPTVDWSKVAVDFCIIQIGGGYVARKKDAMYESHYAGAKSRGIPVGGYWFTQAMNEQEAREEADICIDLMKGKQFEFPIWLDLEQDRQFKLGKAKVSAIIRAWLERVEKAGYWVGLYTNLSGLTYYVEDDIKKRYSVWLAQWDVQKPSIDWAGIWQTGTATVAGFPEPVDSDIGYVDYTPQIKAKGLNGYGKPPKPPEQPDTDAGITVEMTVDGKRYGGTLKPI